MVSTKVTVVEALEEILPTEWEISVDSSSTIPCITYRESNGYDYVSGTTFGYNKVSYLIKLWANSIADIETYQPQIDDNMRELGFSKDNTNEIADNGIICKLTNYTAIAREFY